MSAQDAKHRFALYTAGTGDINYLYGPVNAPCRATILTDLTGQPVPKSKAGWNHFCRAIMDLYGVTGDCIVARERNLRAAVLREARAASAAYVEWSITEGYAFR
jgi:hypothetical protein